MSIEQTSQLILLILNSVLMTLLSSILLGGAWLRQNALMQQLSKTRSHYRQLTRAVSGSATDPSAHTPSQTPSQTPADLKQVRARRAQLSCQYQWSRIGMLILHTTLLTFSVSLFALALRSLLAFDSLISTALFLFTVGAAGLLVGTGCILIDFAKGNSSHDSLGQTFGRLLKQLNQQWKRRSLQLGVQAAKPLAKGTDTLVGRGE
ncbi:MAG: hypothetical protein AAF810_09950 [Cyanobacteria bacterium P01_D01_bin.36]